MHDLLLATQRFAVHVLSEKQVRWNINMYLLATSLEANMTDIYLLQVHYSVHFSRPVPDYQNQFDSIPHQLGLAVSDACTHSFPKISVCVSACLLA